MSREDRIQAMRDRVCQANLQLPQWGLVTLTWGNVSEIDRDLGVIVIKPSGVDYDVMEPSQMVVTDLDGNPLEEGGLNPSSDLATHVYLYKEFTEISSVVHTHSRHAVAWAQAGRELPVYGTTHADNFYGPVPLTRQLTAEEVDQAYEKNTGLVIVEAFHKYDIDPTSTPGVLVNGHGPFTWGESTQEAVENSLVLDEICNMAMMTESISASSNYLPDYVLNKHYQRKHGEDAYYGQG